MKRPTDQRKGVPEVREYVQARLTLRTDCRGVDALKYAPIAGVIVATLLVGFNVPATDMPTRFNNIGFSF